MTENPPQRGPLGSGFTRVRAASTISSVGDGVFLIAMPLLAAMLTRDPFLVACRAVYPMSPVSVLTA